MTDPLSGYAGECVGERQASACFFNSHVPAVGATLAYLQFTTHDRTREQGEGLLAQIPEAMEKLRQQRPTFFYDKAELKSPKYVAWVDIMGAASALAISDVKAAIYIGKLHSCILKSKDITKFDGEIYPFVDGCYITCYDRTTIQRFLKCIFRLMALNFVFEEANDNKYMIRGSLSFGNVIEADSIIDCSEEFKNKNSYTAGILFGSPLARANQAEIKAAPFGIWIDEIARHFCPTNGKTIRTTFWDWWSYPSGVEEVDEYCEDLEKMLAEDLSNYFLWCRRNHYRILYPAEAIERHSSTAAQYFPSWPQNQ